MTIVRPVDFSDEHDCVAFVELLDHYANGPFGDNQPLSPNVKSKLAVGFAAASMTFAFFAELEGVPVGLVTCQEGYSTFRAAPRINVHDLVVHTDHRGNGIGRLLLETVKEDAIERGASAVTLEVRVDNDRARGLYESCGFTGIKVPVPENSLLFGVLPFKPRSE